MATHTDVVLLHRKHPTWSAPLIAAKLGCMTEYVNATARRRGLRLPRASSRSNPESAHKIGMAALLAGLTLKDIEALAASKARR